MAIIRKCSLHECVIIRDLFVYTTITIIGGSSAVFTQTRNDSSGSTESISMKYIDEALERNFREFQETIDCYQENPRAKMRMTIDLLRSNRSELHKYYSGFQAAVTHITNLKYDTNRNIYKLHEFREAIDRLDYVANSGLETVVAELSKTDQDREEERQQNNYWM